MQNLRAAVVFLYVILLAGCATGEHMTFSFKRPVPGKEWKIGYQQELKDQYFIVEYIPSDETLNNWTKMVTIQNFGLKTRGQPTAYSGKTPEELMSDLKEKMEKRCSNTVWNVIEHGQNDVLYEWRIENCSPEPDQHEVARIFDGKWNRFRVAYVSKVKKLPDEERAEWIDNLKKARIEE
ncbi:MAG: hypothetical protein HY204_09705 [Nitrospirae bacterium]|nr:hypothetical protein [Nitrospirota bacterium]